MTIVAMINSGATHNFMNEEVAKKLRLELEPVQHVGFCATLEHILTVILLYCFVPPMEDHTDVIIHVNP